MKYHTLFALMIVLFFACENPNPPQESPPPIISNQEKTEENQEPIAPKVTPKKDEYHFAYDLNSPNISLKLPGKLIEISGLSITEDGEYLLAHNDEQGKIFYINKKNGEIKKDIKFHKNDDYEGIEMVKETIYVTKNTGTIYEVTKPDTKDQETETYKTSLSGAQDVEGLGYNPKTNQLLLACKGKAGDGKEYKRMRAIYGFDLNTKKLLKKPVYLINRDAIKDFIQTNSDRLEKFLEALIPEQAASAFAPSGLAIHPKDGNIYVLSSVGKLLVVLKPNGKIIHIQSLDKNIHQQPEGICFESDGTLWISSEGKGRKARIHRFEEK